MLSLFLLFSFCLSLLSNTHFPTSPSFYSISFFYIAIFLCSLSTKRRKQSCQTWKRSMSRWSRIRSLSAWNCCSAKLAWSLCRRKATKWVSQCSYISVQGSDNGDSSRGEIVLQHAPEITDVMTLFCSFNPSFYSSLYLIPLLKMFLSI